MKIVRNLFCKLNILKGLHNISLQENMCTARVCEVILYILTTLLDLGLLKSKAREKVNNQYYLFEIGDSVMMSWMEPKILLCSSVFSLSNQTVTIVLRLFAQYFCKLSSWRKKLIKLKCWHKYFQQSGRDGQASVSGTGEDTLSNHNLAMDMVVRWILSYKHIFIHNKKNLKYF